jgi:hypothetical protein
VCFHRKVEEQRRNREERSREQSTRETTEKSKGMVTIPYVKGVSEPLQRVFRKHNIATASRPHMTLRKLLVHPKDKVDDIAKTDCVYKIPCKSCEQVYIGETGRTLGTRLEEHKKDAESARDRRFTRGQRREAENEENKSAVTDHINRNNCVIDWEGAKVVDREDNRRTRWIKESIWIRKSTPVMNRDEGGYRLSHVWDDVITAAPSGGGR